MTQKDTQASERTAATYHNKKLHTDGKGSAEGKGAGDSFANGMPVAIGQAAMDIAQQRPPGYFPQNAKDTLSDMTSSAMAQEYAKDLGLGMDIGPSPFGSSHPDLQRNDAGPYDPNLYATNPNKAPNSTRTSDGFKLVVLKATSNGAYVATGKINGVKVTFLVDTGATQVCIPGRVARQAKVELTGTGSRAHTANGVIHVEDAMIETLSLGSIELSGIEATVNPKDYGNKVLLGMSALKQLHISISEGKLLLRQSVVD